MSKQPGKPTLKQVYRQQYRQESSSKTSRAFRIISPLVFLIGAIFLRHSPVVVVILGAAAIVILAVVIIWSKQQHDGTGET